MGNSDVKTKKKSFLKENANTKKHTFLSNKHLNKYMNVPARV